MFQNMEYMYAVYRERSFSKAAKKMFISQPSLSASVKRVEERIGFPVFDRSTKPLRLTECGEKYIESVERILAIQNEFTDYVNDLGGLHIGRLTLGGSNLFSSWVLPPLIQGFLKKFPQVQIELVEESTPELASMLQSGRIDLMLDNCDLDRLVFDRRKYREERLLLAAPKQLPVNGRLSEYQIAPQYVCDRSYLDEKWKAVPLKEFDREPFIMLKPENDTRKRAEELLREAGIAPPVVYELDQQMTSYNVTSSGLGISFISDTLISSIPAHDRVCYYKLEGEAGRRNVYFYWKTGRYLSRVMEEFLKYATEYV